jgi:hypothetical protein
MSSLWRQFADPETQLRLSVSISVVALECLVAIWAATGKTHWFWRVLAVWAAIMLMVPIRAWEPAWMFGLGSPLIVLLIRGWGWIDRCFSPRSPGTTLEKRPYRFSLLDLLLLMLAVGLWLPGVLEIVRHWQPKNWLAYFATSVSVALLAVGSCSCTRMPLRWPHVGLLALGLFEVAGAWWLEYPVLSTIAAVAGATAYLYAFDRRRDALGGAVDAVAMGDRLAGQFDFRGAHAAGRRIGCRHRRHRGAHSYRQPARGKDAVAD